MKVFAEWNDTYVFGKHFNVSLHRHSAIDLCSGKCAYRTAEYKIKAGSPSPPHTRHSVVEGYKQTLLVCVGKWEDLLTLQKYAEHLIYVIITILSIGHHLHPPVTDRELMAETIPTHYNMTKKYFYIWLNLTFFKLTPAVRVHPPPPTGKGH